MMKSARSIFAPTVFFLVLLLLPGGARADSVNASMSLDRSTFDSTSTDAAGNTMKTKARDFSQQYNVYMHLTPLPTLNVSGGLNVGKDLNDTTPAGGARVESSTTTVRPSIEVALNDPFRVYFVGVGYSQLESTSRSSNSPSVTTVNEDYHASLGWRPFELPSVDVRVTRTNLYDKERVSQNMTTDSILLSSYYHPRTGLDLNYQAGYTDSLDKISDLETRTVSQSARGTYTDTFANNRVSLNTGYTVAASRTEVVSQGAGEISFQLFPFAGLSSVTDTPTLDTLSPNAALIDGNLAASANINLGSSLSLTGDTRTREMGIDFFAATEVNNVLIWVDRQLTPEIANSFSWDIYTSQDNVNWTFLQNVLPAPFGPFLNRFTIDFQSVQTRYLKVVTRPLALAVQGAGGPNFQNIFVTEMQAFFKQTAQQVKNESRQLSQLYNLNVRTQLLNTPSLYYDFFYYLSKTSGATSATRYTISNGLSLLHRFNPVLSGSARTAWEDTHDQSGQRRDTYSYNAVLTAVPLPTLRAGAVFAGNIAKIDSKSSENNAFQLNGNAELYKGISVNASGGVSSGTSETDVKSKSFSFLSGAGFIPHPRLTVNLSYTTSRTTSYGGGQPFKTSSSTEREEASTAYRPVDTAYLTASISRQSTTGQRSFTLQNYGLNWSPFPDGTLQFHFTYNENMRSDTDTREKAVGPGVTWLIIPRASLDVSYLKVTTDSPTQTGEIKSLDVSYRMTF